MPELRRAFPKRGQLSGESNCCYISNRRGIGTAHPLSRYAVFIVECDSLVSNREKKQQLNAERYGVTRLLGAGGVKDAGCP